MVLCARDLAILEFGIVVFSFLEDDFHLFVMQFCLLVKVDIQQALYISLTYVYIHIQYIATVQHNATSFEDCKENIDKLNRLPSQTLYSSQLNYQSQPSAKTPANSSNHFRSTSSNPSFTPQSTSIIAFTTPSTTIGTTISL